MNMFRRDKVQTPAVPPRPTKEEKENPITHSLTPASQENNNEVKTKTKRTGVMGVMQHVNPFKSTPPLPPRVNNTSSSESLEHGTGSTQRTVGAMQQVDPFKSMPPLPPRVGNTSSSESLEQGTESTQNPGKLKGVMQKVNPFKSTSQVPKAPSSESLEQSRVSDSHQNPGMFKGVMHKVNPFKSSTRVPNNDPEEVCADPQETGRENPAKQNPGMITGMMQKVNPFKSSQPKDPRPLHDDLSSSSGSLDNTNLPEKQNPGMFRGMMQKVNPFKSHAQTPADDCQTDSAGPNTALLQTREVGDVHSENSSSSDSVDDIAIERHSTWYVDSNTSSEVTNPAPVEAPKKRTVTFRIKRILPRALFGSKGSASGEAAVPEEVVETLTLAEVPAPLEGTTEDPLDDEDGLLAWWRTVDGWEDWNAANKDDEPEEVVEEAADRVFMAARLFVRFFNQRGAVLQQRILELLSLADAADNFHKKTVTASVGGGVASIAGSITTITGLILAPFTAGASLIVTAVGIGVATAGGLASASANITDTVHSKTDRKKVEKMIQDYEEEMKDIKDCLQFLQEGMETLEEWDFEKYADSISKKHLNQNVKHVMKEGGRAGKSLVINTESLINTVQVLTVAGGAAKAAQVMSVTTGVMSGLFLALDVFFLAKDSMELRKGAKTEFAAKIREVCKSLQDGLLLLNSIKEQLQKTMDGIEVEVEEEEEDEEQLKSDLKKLVELEEDY